MNQTNLKFNSIKDCSNDLVIIEKELSWFELLMQNFKKNGWRSNAYRKRKKNKYNYLKDHIIYLQPKAFRLS